MHVFRKLFVSILVITALSLTEVSAQSKSTAQDELNAKLFEACEKGDLTAAKAALSKGANPNASEYDGETPLMKAARGSKFDLINFLLTTKANPVMQDDLGNTAADLMGLDVLGNSGTDSTALVLAGDKMQKRLAEAAKEAKSLAENLVTAISDDETTDAIQLINKGAYIDFIDKRDPLRPTPLTLAADHKNIEILKLLLSKGARVDRHNAKDGTAIKYAVANKDNESVKLLLKSDADVDVYDNDGFTPIMIAASIGNLDGAKLVLGYKPDLSAVAYVTKDSALHLAIASKHPEMVPLLLNAGANPNLQDEKGATPLVFAAGVGDLASAILLLKSGANPNLKTKSGGSAADYAKKKYPEIAKVLTEGTYTKPEFKTP